MDETSARDLAPQPPNGPQRGSHCAWVLQLLFLLLVAYPLSLGPAVKLLKSYPAIRPLVEAAYAPLVFLADRWSLLYDFLSWYIKTVWKVQ